MKERTPLRIDDGAVHDDARVAHEPVEERPEARVATEGCRPLGTRRLENVGRLVKELAREEVALVRRVPERQARERREVRQRRDRDHEEDDEGEAEKLARAGAQSHTLDPRRRRAASALTAADCTGSACCGGSSG